MISINIHKSRRNEQWRITALDDGNGQREIVSGGAATPREAALWLLRKAYQLTDEIEEQLVELGLLSEAECAAVRDEEPEAPP